MYENIQYLSVGELAKEMNVSVRTIQYYDQIGLLSPTELTEGGRRLYTMKDYIILYQIVSLKEFGFSLKEIRDRLMPADTIEEIEEYLMIQENNIQKEIKILEKKYELISKFRKEMIKVKKIDWGLFGEILSLLRNEDENYWVVKYFDKDVFERIKSKHTNGKGKNYYVEMSKLCDKALELKNEGIASEDEEGIKLAEAWWQKVMDFTDGDMEMIQQMVDISSKENHNSSTFMKKFKMVEDYINKALTAYFQENSIKIMKEMGVGEND